MRHPDVGEHSDTWNYLNSFDYSQFISWGDVFKQFIPTYFAPTYDGLLSKDPGFTVFEKIVRIFTSDYQVYLIVIAILCIVPLSLFIYKNVKNYTSILLAYSYYVYFYFSYIPNSSIRQSLALGLLFFSYDYLQKNKLIKSLLILVLASTLHKSVFIFALFVILHRMGLHKIVFTNAIWLFFIVLFSYQVFAPLLAQLGDVYSVYANTDFYTTHQRSYTYLAFSLLIYLLILIPLITKKENEFEDYRMAYLASSFALLLTPLLLLEPTILRIIVYFAVWNFVLIPHSVNLYEKSMGNVILIVLIVLFLMTSFRVTNDYRFFWQTYERTMIY